MVKLIESERKTVVTRCWKTKKKRRGGDVDQKDINFNYKMNMFWGI